MADKLTISLELEPNLSKQSRKDIEKQAGVTGEQAGESFEKGFEDETRNLGKSASIGLTKLRVAALAAGVALVRGFGSAINLAEQQEDAINRLNTALKISGDFSTTASQDFQQYANALQSVTRFGDEVILNQLALAKSFGATNEQSKQVVNAATDLAEAFGIDLESATRNVAKTLGGYAGELGEVLPALKNLTQEQLRAGEGIKVISEQFGGTAQQRVKTFSGITEQLGNTFGDVLEEIGFFITKNDTLLAGLEAGVGILSSFGDGLKFIREELLGIQGVSTQDELGKLQAQLKGVDEEIASLVDREQELRGGFLTNLGKSLGLDALVENDIKAADKLEGTTNKLLQQRQSILNQIKELEEAQTTQTQKAQESAQQQLTDQQLLAQARITNDRLIVQSFQEREALLSELFTRGLITRQEAETAQRQLAIEEEEQLQAFRDSIAQRRIENEADVAGAVLLSARRQQASYVALGKALTDLSVRGFGRAFQNIGRALASGENANQAFIDTVKNTFGELASAAGDFYIKKGIALSLDPTGAGASAGLKLIAAGAGLKALSGALSVGSSSGGGGSFSAAPTGTFDDPINTRDSLSSTEPVERAEAQGNVTINIDRFVGEEEEAQRVAELLSDAGAKNGVLLTDVRSFA